jgi:hypothetical protein
MTQMASVLATATVLLPRAHAQGVKQSVLSVCLSVSTKIARSEDLSIFVVKRWDQIVWDCQKTSPFNAKHSSLMLQIVQIVGHAYIRHAFLYYCACSNVYRHTTLYVLWACSPQIDQTRLSIDILLCVCSSFIKC